MSSVSDVIRDHRRALLESLRERAARLAVEGRPGEGHGLASFLGRELLPHGRGSGTRILR